jgi:hypothetical protein
MRYTSKLRLLCGLVVTGLMAHAPSAMACAACFGKSDSALAKGMNWGIFVLLGVVSMVLMGFAGMGFYIVRRGSAIAAAQSKAESSAKDQA